MPHQAALSLPIGRAFDLLCGRARLMQAVNERARAEAESTMRAGRVGRSGGGVPYEERPDGTRVYRFTGSGGLEQLMGMMRQEQAARRASKDAKPPEQG